MSSLDIKCVSNKDLDKPFKSAYCTDLFDKLILESRNKLSLTIYVSREAKIRHVDEKKRAVAFLQRQKSKKERKQKH